MAEPEKAMAHTVILEERSKLAVSGVTEVLNFDETGVAVDTVAGRMQIRGNELHVEKLQLDSGELTVIGQITDLEYEEARPTQSSGIFSRLFR